MNRDKVLQAEIALRRALALRPHDVPTLEKLGTVQRVKGDLAAALETYRRITGLCPGHPEASWLSAVLGGAALSDVPAPEGTSPAPFVRMTDFFPRERCDELLALVTAERERFVPAKISGGKLYPDQRHALVADRRIRQEVRAWFIPRLRGVAEAVLARLPMRGFDAYNVELDVTAYPDGHFYKVHCDWSNEYEPHRWISYVWYFYREPRRFSGGDLLLHDTDRETGRYTGVFTRLAPLHNSIVFFPSDCYHQVTPVHGDGDDFGDGRFSVNGWILGKSPYFPQRNGSPRG